MRQTKAMGPNYSVRWWRDRNLKPPEIDCQEFLLKRIRWRYAKGSPKTSPQNTVKFGDSTSILLDVVDQVSRGSQKRCSLLFTSPPYYGVTNYHADQWLRLWLLEGPEYPKYSRMKYKGRFSSKESYCELLESVFNSVSQVMSSEGTIYVRTSAREFTFNTTIGILRKYFPSWKENIIPKPFGQKTQTHLFGDLTKKPGEMDIIFTSR